MSEWCPFVKAFPEQLPCNIKDWIPIGDPRESFSAKLRAALSSKLRRLSDTALISTHVF